VIERDRMGEPLPPEPDYRQSEWKMRRLELLLAALAGVAFSFLIQIITSYFSPPSVWNPLDYLDNFPIALAYIGLCECAFSALRERRRKRALATAFLTGLAAVWVVSKTM